MKTIKTVLIAVLLAPVLAWAAGAELHLDKFSGTSEPTSLQNGAKLFVNYCLNCHGASYMRYNRLTDIGLTDDQIRQNLMFTAEKIGEPMSTAIRPAEAKQWFGVPPPDLSVIARSRASEFGSGADWLYTYLRSFYRDPSRPTGWNNTVFENVGMPHALWQLQGIQDLQVEKTKDAAGHEVEVKKLVLVQPGSMKPEQYDAAVADLVSFLVYIGEPAAATRKQLGIWVLIVLGVLFVLSFALKKNYWKDVH
jgi:ubiquinol-cytochrome c reductase cytochrome c1 subunit